MLNIKDKTIQILGFGFGSVKNVINAGNENNLIDTRQ
jgi:hypothetical protein